MGHGDQQQHPVTATRVPNMRRGEPEAKNDDDGGTGGNTDGGYQPDRSCREDGTVSSSGSGCMFFGGINEDAFLTDSCTEAPLD